MSMIATRTSATIALRSGSDKLGVDRINSAKCTFDSQPHRGDYRLLAARCHSAHKSLTIVSINRCGSLLPRLLV
jgi:hypothetical protein